MLRCKFDLQALLILFLWAGLSKEASSFSISEFCRGILGNLAVNPSVETYPKDQIEITRNRQGFWSTYVHLGGPNGFELQGTQRWPRYRLENARAVYPFQLLSLFGLQTEGQQQFTILGFGEDRPSTRGSYPFLWQMALRHPRSLKTYGIVADSFILILPTVDTLNQRLEALRGSIYGLGQRYEEWYPKRDENVIDSMEFFKSFVNGKVPLAVRGWPANHTLDNLLGGFMVPLPVFQTLHREALWINKLLQDPIIQGQYWFHLKIQNAAKSFQGIWRGLTSSLVYTLPIEVGYQYGLVSEDVHSLTVRRLILKLASGYSLSEAELGAIQGKYFEVTKTLVSDLYSLWGLPESLHFSFKGQPAFRHFTRLDAKRNAWRHELNVGIEQVPLKFREE